jgi:ADP-ribosylglycohydrolase
MGVAVGDAMGMPSEMWSRQKIARHFGEINTFLPGPPENSISKGLAAGEVTDDTLLSLLVAESMIEQGGRILPQQIMEKIIEWAQKDTAKINNIIGPSTKKAFALFSQGIPIVETGKFGTTNGGAMRIIPVGIISDWRKLDILVENVRLACLPTHNTSTAIGGAAAIAAAVSYCIDGDNDLDTMLQVAKIACQKGLCLGYQTIGASISKRIEIGIEIVKSGNSVNEILQNIYDIIGSGLATTESVPAALTLVYLAQGDPVKCAYLAANLGGDTDTIGAMSCGICGAFSGITAFPADYINLITKTNAIDFSHVAQKLWMYRIENCK